MSAAADKRIWMYLSIYQLKHLIRVFFEKGGKDKMPVKIIGQSDNFLLEGGSRSFHLTVDCSVQLKRYNSNGPVLQSDDELLSGLASAHTEQSLAEWIDALNRKYGLHRRPVFIGKRFAKFLYPRLAEIRQTPEATRDSIDEICQAFERYRSEFSKDLKRKKESPLPDVSLSKLLHFINPKSFWILDSRVETIIGFWGYSPKYKGFGKLLGDLFSDSEFEGFRAFLEKRDKELVGNHWPSNVPISFLKLLDKVLWFTND